MIESLIEKEGHLVVFLPKFHCELNAIEMQTPSHSPLEKQMLWVDSSLNTGIRSCLMPTTCDHICLFLFI